MALATDTVTIEIDLVVNENEGETLQGLVEEIRETYPVDVTVSAESGPGGVTPPCISRVTRVTCGSRWRASGRCPKTRSPTSTTCRSTLKGRPRLRSAL